MAVVMAGSGGRAEEKKTRLSSVRSQGRQRTCAPRAACRTRYNLYLQLTFIPEAYLREFFMVCAK